MLSWRSTPPLSLKIHVFPPLLPHAAYNAIWNPEDGSVTRFLQCKGCLSQRSVLSAAIIAAEIQHPRHEAQDKVNLGNMWSLCTYNSCMIKKKQNGGIQTSQKHQHSHFLDKHLAKMLKYSHIGISLFASLSVRLFFSFLCICFYFLF